MADTCETWLARAEQARRLAQGVMHDKVARCLVDYAEECELIARSLESSPSAAARKADPR